MMIRVLTFLLSICLSGFLYAVPEEKIVDGITYHILQARAEELRIIWKNREGVQLRKFPEAARYLADEKISVDTLMNGGIFEPGGIPSGLLIQDGKQLRPVNGNNGEGNFFLKPNGIFLIGKKGAAVIDAEEFLSQKDEILQAVQSGPLLLRRGKIHPAFNAGSSSRLLRNGVGVSKNGMVVFAISDFRSPKFPNFYEFAQLFRSLGCDDALFLDGTISQMCSGENIFKTSDNFGSIIAVIKTDSAGAAKP